MRIGALRLLLFLWLGIVVAQPAFAKEPFGIKGILLGSTLAELKEVFPEIIMESFENMARCKSGDVVIENGTSFKATQDDEYQHYIFKLIFIDGIQRVVREEYSYRATSVSRDMFIGKLKEKFAIDDINANNISKVKNSMSDYKGITNFVRPTGHFFNILEDDILRLKYSSVGTNVSFPSELTHSIIIESQKYRLIDADQEKLGEQERIAKEQQCGLQELQEIGL